jgi:hypothetical protein
MNGPRAKRALISAGIVRTGGCAVVDTFARELERHLGDLLHGGSAPWEFRRWFASALWASEGSVDGDTLDFAYEIENIIAERSGDHITDAEMVDALRQALAARNEEVQEEMQLVVFP